MGGVRRRSPARYCGRGRSRRAHRTRLASGVRTWPRRGPARVSDRWATFDCYGTLIDWHGGIRSVFRRLWVDQDPERLLARHHAVEPLVQEGRSLPYRDVGARTLRAIAAIEA